MRTAIERRISALELRKDNGSLTVHFVEAIDRADSRQQIAELEAAGRVGPRDGFLCLIGSIDHGMAQGHSARLAVGQRTNP